MIKFRIHFHTGDPVDVMADSAIEARKIVMASADAGRIITKIKVVKGE